MSHGQQHAIEDDSGGEEECAVTIPPPPGWSSSIACCWPWLISLVYGPGLLFRGPFCRTTSNGYSWKCHKHLDRFSNWLFLSLKLMTVWGNKLRPSEFKRRRLPIIMRAVTDFLTLWLLIQTTAEHADTNRSNLKDSQCETGGCHRDVVEDSILVRC